MSSNLGYESEKTLEDKDIEDFSEFLDNETELDIDAFSDRED